MDIEVTNPDVYKEYRRQVPPLVAKHGGKYLVRGARFEIVEGDWSPKRLVLLEFESFERAKQFHESEEYEPLKQVRLSSTNSNAVLVEGL